MSQGDLAVRGLRVAAGGREVIHGIDLDVPRGQVHVVMGPNGSGKSTLAHALTGRPGVEVTAGDVTLDGQPLLGLPAWQRARHGLLLALQQPIAVPGVDLGALLGAATDGLDAPQAAALAERVVAEADAIGFDRALLTRSVNVDLSGGERKRSEILQLGVLRPKFCVLDEIDSGLDVDALRAVARRIERATQEWGLGVLAVTHFQRLLVELRADAVHVLVDGSIVATGGAELAQELEVTGYGAYARPPAP